jgi:hypothetical protein
MPYVFAAISALALIGLFALERRRRARRAWQAWDMALSPRGTRAYEDMRHRMNDELALADMALVAAAEAQTLGSTDEAIRLLEAGGRLVETHAPNMRRMLAGMAVLSRMVSAMAPVTPLRPRDFELRQLVRLAQVNRLLHHILVTAGERFRFRVYVLRAGFSVAARWWLHQTGRIRRHEGEVEAAWLGLEAVRRDVHTLTDESLETFRVLVLSLSRSA